MLETAPTPATVHLVHARTLAAPPRTAEFCGDDRAHDARRADTVISVTEAQVRRGDVRALRTLGRRLESPRCGGLRPGGLEVVFAGRGLTDTPVYLQPEVRAYARRLEAVCPAWFYLFSASGEGLLALTLARLGNVWAVQAAGSARVAAAFRRGEFQEFLLEQSQLMRTLFTRFGLGRAAYHRRLAELSRRFGLTEPGDWAEPS